MTDQVCQITVYIQGPVLLGDESSVGNYEQTLGYIPGAVLRGAIATHVLHTDAQAFQRIFDAAEHPPRFGNAYPAWPEVWAYPFPATARTCKQYPGYVTDWHEKHGVFDILVEQTLYELLSDPCFPYRDRLLPALGNRRVELSTGYEPRCPYGQDEQCSESTQPAAGYYVLRSKGPGPSPKTLISRATHVGINRARGVAEDALLFTLETIEHTANLQFRGQLVYDDVYQDDMERLIGLRGQTNSFRIGRGRSRGMGLADIQIDTPPAASDDNMEDRLDLLQREFRNTIQERYARTENLDLAPGYFFSLTLRSPAILVDSDRLPSLWPDLSQTELAAAWPLRAWARTMVVGGWDAAADLPRRTRQAVEAGAVYLYYVPETALPKATLLPALEKLELQGIGEQRERGYGQLTVCAPFHYAGWSHGDAIASVLQPTSESRETRLLQRAEQTVAGVRIAPSDEDNLKPSQIELLLREAQAGYGVEHVLNWLRYQQARVKGWQKSGLAERIVQDIDALYQEARDVLDQSGVEITKKRLGDAWSDLVQGYLAYLSRWYQVAWKQRGGSQ